MSKPIACVWLHSMEQRGLHENHRVDPAEPAKDPENFFFVEFSPLPNSTRTVGIYVWGDCLVRSGFPLLRMRSNRVRAPMDSRSTYFQLRGRDSVRAACCNFPIRRLGPKQCVNEQQYWPDSTMTGDSRRKRRQRMPYVCTECILATSFRLSVPHSVLRTKYPNAEAASDRLSRR